MRPSSDERIPALDGLRGLAILLVMYYHIMGICAGYGYVNGRLLSITNSFHIGVDLFFVISGYLITGILVSKRRSENYFKAFYWRRFLRIVPLYFVSLAALALVFPQEIRVDNFGWFALFLTNLYFFVSPVHVVIAPLWSVALEEQFYLLWPTVTRYIRPAILTSVVAFLFATQPLVRLIIPEDIYFHPLTRLDGLLAGAFIALSWPRIKGYFGSSRQGLAIASVSIAYLFIRASFPDFRYGSASLVVHCLDFTLVTLCFAAILCCAIAGSHVLKKMLSNRVLVSFGVHSYALYLFHLLIAFGVAQIGFVPTRGSFLANVILSLLWSTAVVALSWLVAKLCWRFIEHPSLRHKDRVSYGSVEDVTGSLQPVKA